MIPVEEFKSAEDSFTGFKDYITALEKAVELDKFHKVDIIDSSENSFGFNVKFCIM
ncbi:MAG: hypothetical protein GY749_45440 [Desulfobacteraceae bacterium]|nr:hypothetical protein [Desulfobacteraceae bacterium]